MTSKEVREEIQDTGYFNQKKIRMVEFFAYDENKDKIYLVRGNNNKLLGLVKEKEGSFELFD